MAHDAALSPSGGYRLGMRILLDACRYSDAAAICLRALGHCHADASLCAELIGTVYGLGLYEQALQAPRLQIQRQPRRLDAYLLAAQCSVVLERFDQASQCPVQVTRAPIVPGRSGVAGRNVSEAAVGPRLLAGVLPARRRIHQQGLR